MNWPRCEKHNIFFMPACPDCKREKLPSFDEWFKGKYGVYFEDCHMLTGGHIAEDMKKLTRHMREYVSEMVRTE